MFGFITLLSSLLWIKYLETQRLEANEEIDDGLISKRLREDYLKQVGKFRSTVADDCKVDTENLTVLRCKDHKTTVTCLCTSNDGKFVYSGSKNGGVVKCKQLNRLTCRM